MTKRNIDDFQRHSFLTERSQTQKAMHDTYLRDILEETRQRDMKECPGVTELFYFLIEVVVEQLYAFVKRHKTVYQKGDFYYL